uniref:Uncharacterized protein n=1 Tax=Zooxanthella nutricula TaxID=1333877 RepID=A0A7S2PX10_9DINO
MQPDRVPQNRLAGPGAVAPVVEAHLVQAPSGSVEVLLTCVGGATAEAVFGCDATLGDVASRAVEQFRVLGGLVHLIVQGVAVRPLEAARLLAACVRQAQGSDDA